MVVVFKGLTELTEAVQYVVKKEILRYLIYGNTL
jgi:hypothetical protein